MKIVVPSLGRAGIANSMKWLPAAGRDIIFAVHYDEVLQYAEVYGEAINTYGKSVSVLNLSDECRKHTGLVRKEIMERIREPFFFVDDDIRISLKFSKSISQIFDLLENHISCGASMAGLAQQLFSNTAAEKAELINGDIAAVRNKFVATVYAINPLVFDDCPLETLPVYEDVALVIHAIQSGGGTIVSYQATHSNVSPSSGGCNSWRNARITLDSLKTLVELYPGICSIKETQNTTHSQNLGIGLRTAWSKIRKLS